MSRSVVRLPMGVAPRCVRVLDTTGRTESPSPGAAARATRLLAARDAAVEQQRVHQAMQACATAMQNGLRDLRERVDVRLAEVAELASEIGIVVAGEIVGDAIARASLDLVPIVQRCLQQVVRSGERADVTVFLAPDDHARCAALQPVPPWGEVRLQVDPALATASVRVESGAGAVTYDPRVALARVCDELRKELAACR